MDSAAKPPSRHRRLGWRLCGFSAVVFLAVNLLPAVVRLRDAPAADWKTVAVGSVAFLGFAVVGAAVTASQPFNRVGWLLVAAGLFGAVGLAGLSLYAAYALERPATLPGGDLADLLAQRIAAPLIVLLVIVLPLHFPDGRLRTLAARAVVWSGVSAALVTMLAHVLDPAATLTSGRINPYGIGAGSVFRLVGGATTLVFAVSCLAAAVLVMRRFRAATGDERQQLRWFAAAVLFFLGVIALALVGEATGVSGLIGYTPLAALFLAAAIGVAVLKYRLYDLDIVVNRAAVYGALTAAVVGLYVLIVALLGAAATGSSRTASVGAVVVVALVVAPLRTVLQKVVNRLMYGQRDDPFSVVAMIGERLEHTAIADAILPDVLATMGRALRLRHVAVQTATGERSETLAEWGAPCDNTLHMPLSYQGEEIGRLVVAGRRGEQLTSRDRVLIDTLTPHIATAVCALSLTVDLRRSRERLVSSREDERRRLRRDLHDGLGSTLTGVALQADGAIAQLSSNPAASEALLRRLKADAQAAIGEVRRLVYELRPPALDELGLVGAVRQQASRFDSGVGTRGSLLVTIDAREPLPPLSAAIEVAAYRIVSEALTNVTRHAEATRCSVRVSVNGALDIEVRDNGRGFPDVYRAGLGLASMRERAAEVGGTCSIEALTEGGTRVIACLPLDPR